MDYLAIKRNEILIHVITQMNFKTMLRQRGQSQKTTHGTAPFISTVQKSQSIGTENRLVVTKRRGIERDCERPRDFFFGVIKMFWNLWFTQLGECM